MTLWARTNPSAGWFEISEGKSLSKFEIGYYKTRQSRGGEKPLTWVAVIRKGKHKGFRENQFPQGLIVI